MLLQAPPQRRSLGVKRCRTCQERSARRLSSGDASRATSASRLSRRVSRDSSRTPPPSLRTSVSSSDTDTDTDTDDTAVSRDDSRLTLGRRSEEQQQHIPGSEDQSTSAWRKVATVLVHDLPAFVCALVVVMTCGGVNPSALTL
ncbi:uncharacterized protein LOC62_04G006042 [Vanrija pseudolonga]|uniref:Uncharacterized protein n=1 Tax=Vanrija pseudolonga TaxID=143232 RepID=A0AAF1BRS3_9TREE|nr:hypothetical protein LOC62_04G006042 [Vanrija pseudolonga]